MPIQDLRLHTSIPLGDAQVAQLADRGLRVVSRLPGNAYRVRGDSTTTAADLVGLDFVDTASAYDPMDKLDSSLAAASAMVMASVAGGAAAPVVNVLASLDPEVDTEATAEQLAALGDVVENTSRRVLVRVSTDRLAEPPHRPRRRHHDVGHVHRQLARPRPPGPDESRQPLAGGADAGLGAQPHHDGLELRRHAHPRAGGGRVAAAGQFGRREGPGRLHLGRSW